jgi:hypothetical protein
MHRVGIRWSAAIKFTAFSEKGEHNSDSQQTRYYHQS